MLSAFGDESSDATGQRVFAVAGLVGSQADWDEFRRAWLGRTGGIEFHAADCESDRGVFAGIPHKENLRLYADLVTVLAGTKLLGFARGINLEEYYGVFPNTVPGDHPYYLCFLDVIKELANVGYLSIPQESVKFTFDQNRERQYNAAYMYQSLAEGNEWLEDKLAFATRKSPCIQAADLVAREAMKHLDNQIGPRSRLPRRSIEILDATNRFRFHYHTSDSLLALKRFVEQIPNEEAVEYFKWLSQRNRQDNVLARMEFLRQYDAKV